jgi:hypothetical protein
MSVAERVAPTVADATATDGAASSDQGAVSHEQPPTHENFARAVFVTLALVWAAIIVALATWVF